MDPIPAELMYLAQQADQMMLDPSSQVMSLAAAQKTASDGIDLSFLPQGITPADFANMPPEHQFLVEQQMMQTQQQARMKQYAKTLNDDESDQLLFDKEKPQEEEESDSVKKVVRAKRFNGLLEWVLDQESHEYLVDVDREFIKNKENLIGLKEKLQDELNLKDEKLDDR